MFNKITENVEIHQTLPDIPNMTTQELKREWDKGNKIIKEAFNACIDELNKTITSSKVLYENTTGSNKTITLNETIANYNRAKIFYKYNNIYGSVEVYNPNNKIISLSIAFSVSVYNLARIQYKNIKIFQNKITNEGFGYLSINTDGKTDVNIEENAIYITKIIGYKEENNE
jgi:hypothetical protein